MSKELRALMLAACAAGAIALSGCGGEKAKDGSSAAAGGGPKAGQWEATMTLEKVEIDEVDPELKEFFQSAVGQVKTTKSCLTAEAAGKPNADFFQGENSGCKYDTFTMSDGKIDSQLSCEDGGAKMKVTMTGTYTEDSYEIQSTAEGDVLPETPGSMAMTAKAKRLGDCPAEEAKPAAG